MRRLPTLLTLLLLLVGALPALAQEESPPTLEEMRQMLEAQHELIVKQGDELARQGQLLTHQQQTLDAITRVLGEAAARGTFPATATHSSSPKYALASTQSTQDESLPAPEVAKKKGDAAEDSASQDKPTSAQDERLARETSVPTDILREGDFPGSIHLPGTDLNAKVGGFVRLSTVNNLDPIGSDDRFIVGSIPPEGEATAGEAARSTISAKRSRVNMDIRMDSDVGLFRAFLEGDFAGDGGTENYRLRHAYGQFNKLLLGQTWSTFMDLSAIPEDVDFEGLSAQINVRHPLMRWAGLALIGQNWAFAFEDPEPSFSGGDGSSTFSDVVMNTSWSRSRRHMQLGLLGRTLKGKETLEDGTQGKADSALGYGLSLSGTVAANRRNNLDNLKFQLNAGKGIGNYVNDLRSIGGQDGVFDPETGRLELLPVFAGYVGYQRWWKPESDSAFVNTLRSTLVYSYVYIDNYDFQPGDAYKATQRATMNLMVSPISSLDLGMEFLWGSRRNKDNSLGEALQWQLVATFRF